MVEIIRRGELPEEKQYQHTCTNCSTHFKFKRAEARLSPDQRDPGYFIPCPLCKQNCWMTKLTLFDDRPAYGGGSAYWDR